MSCQASPNAPCSLGLSCMQILIATSHRHATHPVTRAAVNNKQVPLPTCRSAVAISSRHSIHSVTRAAGTDTTRPRLAACSAAICSSSAAAWIVEQVLQGPLL